MFRTRTACAALLLAGSLTTSGCLFSKKQTKVFVPPPVYAKTPPPANPTPVAASLPPGGDPEIEPVVAGIPNLPPAPPKPLPPKAPAVVKPAPAPVEEIAPGPVTPAPKPATILSAEERRRMDREMDDSLDKVRKALVLVEGKTLPADVSELANSARAFLQNAEQTRVQDLVTAVSLAKRAESFATDLVQRLR